MKHHPTLEHKKGLTVGSRWTHAICLTCWTEKQPGREPYRAAETEPENCCYCGARTRAGIYVPGNPIDVPCGGTGSRVHLKKVNG